MPGIRHRSRGKRVRGGEKCRGRGGGKCRDRGAGSWSEKGRERGDQYCSPFQTFKPLSGTWWVGTGEKFDPDDTVAMPAGSYVVHYGGKVHFDGAKNEETVIQVWGMGPATSTPAERK